MAGLTREAASRQIKKLETEGTLKQKSGV
ncbi:hypothetical protein H0X09_02105 [Candidatus Saccharibacteria bacterium]|nr:hypothetical protein [Candidatus Saccharibacteria bacterium]